MPYRSIPRLGWSLAVFMLLEACAMTPGFGGSRTYAFDNSVSAACRANPAHCAELTGKASTAGSGQAVATAGYTTYQTLRILDNVTQASIDEALKNCAEEARLTVLLRYDGTFKGPRPNADECRELVQDSGGRRVTWAMKLGLEMHDVALRCAAERLGTLRPGGFSIEPRYRYDPKTREKRLISPEEERALDASGNSSELLGTIKPDLVIHAGDPLQVLTTYDFKFPCVTLDQMPGWREYPAGSPYEGRFQNQVYQEALSAKPLRVAPYIGVMP